MKNVMLYCTAPILAEGVRCIMAGLDDFQLIESCSSVDSLKNEIKTHLPELLLAEVTPSITLDFLQELMDASRASRVVLWIDGASPDFLTQSLAMGVRGILRKRQSLEAHVQCLHSVAAGEVWLDQELAGVLLSRKQVSLTPRQRQLIGLLVQGLKNKEIAHALGITESTVKVYLSRLFTKVGANDRFDLALMGLRNVEANQRYEPDRVATKPTGRAIPLTIPPYLSTGPSHREA